MSLLLAAFLFWPGLVLMLALPGLLLLPHIRSVSQKASLPAAMALGPAIWVTILFLLATLRLLSFWSTVFLVVILLLALWWRRKHLMAPMEGETRFSWIRLLPAIAVIGALLLCLLALAARPTISWDDDVYHLTLPRIYLEHGGFIAQPLNVYSNWPMAVDLLFTGAMSLGTWIHGKLVHLALGFFLVIVLAHVCRMEKAAPGMALAGCLFLANPVVLLELARAYVDVGWALFQVVAFYLAVCAGRRADDERSGQTLLLAGVVSGFAASCKPNGMISAAVVSLTFVYLARNRLGTLRALGRALILVLVPACLFLLPWLAKSYVFTGNPFYPFFSELFHSPDWSPRLTQDLMEWQRSIGFGRSPMDYLKLPFRVVLQAGHGYHRFDGSIHPAWLLLIPAALILGRRVLLVRAALVAALVNFVLWALFSQQMRFLIPVLPLLALATAVAVGRRMHNLEDQSRRHAWCWGINLVAALFLLQTSFPVLHRATTIMPELMRPTDVLLEEAVPHRFRYVNEVLPEEAKLLFVNTNRGFFCHRPYLADSFFEASQVAWLMAPAQNQEELASILEDRGITHLLIATDDWNISYPMAFYGLLTDPRLIRPLYLSPDGRYQIVELNPGEQP